MYTRPIDPNRPPEPKAAAQEAPVGVRPYLLRLLWVFLFSVAFTIAFNEGAFMLQKEHYDRAPMTIQLVIPRGASEQVEAGQEVATIPDEMVFVVGDVLEVKNEDTVSHQLGPIWVPPQSSGSLVMKQAEKLAYSCSFQNTRYLGVDVRQATTFNTRLTGLLIAAPTTTALLYIYSILIFPFKPKKVAVHSKEVTQ